MEIRALIEKLNLKIDKSKITYNEEMKKYSTFKIGGIAQCVIKIDNVEDLKEVVCFAKKENIQITILGNGSNVVISDKGIKGITLIIKLDYLKIEKKDDNRVKATIGAGTKLGKIGQSFLKDEITGFEELSGIPGTIGGAVKMNAGAHRKEMKDVVKSIKCIDYEGNEAEFLNENLEFAYRSSLLKNRKYIVTEVELILQKGKKEEIKSKMNEYATYRKEKQPIELPNAGSTFKRGNNFITAKLIEDAGLKGYGIGGAIVSQKHSGFIVNNGNATSKDVLKLVEYVKKEIKNKFDKEIELEIEFIGEE